jgi:hypothetical protein
VQSGAFLERSVTGSMRVLERISGQAGAQA